MNVDLNVASQILFESKNPDFSNFIKYLQKQYFQLHLL